MKTLFEWVLFKLGVWLLSRSFKHIDIYSPDKETVSAITFSINESYINRVQEL